MANIGSHLIIDLWEAENLDDIKFIETTLKNAANKIGATILNSYFHQFSPNGVTGVLVLAESHISIHTWPELKYAAIDVFTCNSIKPHLAIEIVTKAFKSSRMTVQELQRG